MKESGNAVQFADSNFQKLNKINQKIFRHLHDANKLRELCQQARLTLQTISTKSGVGIEPLEQTRLLDQLMRVCPEVAYASVPGAGGDDAIFALSITDNNEAKNQLSLEQRLRSTFLKHHPNLALLPVKLTDPRQSALTLTLTQV